MGHVGATPFFLVGAACLGQVDRDGEKMLESPPSLGLGTVYIAPLQGRTSLNTKV